MSTSARKDAMRKRIRASRRAMGDDERREADAGIAREGAALLARAGARTIACYLSGPVEPPTRALLAYASGAGIRVLLPIIRPHGVLDWAEHTGGERVAALGVPETTGAPLGPGAVAEADLLFVPAAAVDAEGMRLGWGGGFYDRALAALGSRRSVYAVLYDADVVDRVPHEAHDVPVTGVVTPTRTLSFDR